jgi:hypothetical protein
LIVVTAAVAWCWPVASAAVLTVGDHGTYATIQDAVDVALGAGTTEIRVEQGTYVENIQISSSYVSDDIELTGGWDAAFASRSIDASLTVIDGSAVATSVIAISMAGGALLVDGFTITNGFSTQGGGMQVRPNGASWITVSNNRITGNTASSTVPTGGGVLFRQLAGNDARFTLSGNVISGNTSVNTGGGGAVGGGVSLCAEVGSAIEALENRITDNTCLAPAGTVYGCGAYLWIDSGEPSKFSDNVVKGNRSTTVAGSEVFGTGTDVSFGVTGDGALSMRRNLWIDNKDTSNPSGIHVSVNLHSDHSVTISDSVIAGGPNDGLSVHQTAGNSARLTNLTVYHHPRYGVIASAASASGVSMYNTIVNRSLVATSFVGGVDTGGNLLGTDPLFVDPDRWDLRLRTGSPALDAGVNSPPGGLGPCDLDGNPRIIDGTVDIGAYEGVATLFEDGFETGNTSEWSLVVGQVS